MGWWVAVPFPQGKTTHTGPLAAVPEQAGPHGGSEAASAGGRRGGVGSCQTMSSPGNATGKG